MKVNLNRLTLLLPVVAFLALVSCGDNGGTGVDGCVDNTNFSAEEDFYFRIDVVAQSQLSLVGINGSISILGVSGADSVTISGTKRVRSESTEDAEEHLMLLEVNISDLQGEVLVSTSQPSPSYCRSYEVDYEIAIPEDFEVAIENVNGSITIDSIENDIDVAGVNGNVSLDDAVGSASVMIVNGQIDATVTLPADGTVGFFVSNGGISLSIPQSTSASFYASVTNGNITLTNLTPTGGVITPTLVTGTLGDGDGDISLAVTNGNIAATGF
jgi:DUF4097 and DUF4098 domain-containing protein YvlB